MFAKGIILTKNIVKIIPLANILLVVLQAI